MTCDEVCEKVLSILYNKDQTIDIEELQAVTHAIYETYKLIKEES